MSTNYLGLRSTLVFDVGGSTIATGALNTISSSLSQYTTTLANPFTVSSLTGSTITTQNLTVPSTLTVSSLTTTANKAFVCRSSAVPTRYIEMGSDQTNSVYFDFHSSDSVEPDYSTRIQSLQGSTIGGGALSLYGSTIGVNTSTMTSGFTLSTGMTADLGGALKTQLTDTGFNAASLYTLAQSFSNKTSVTASSGTYTFTASANNAGGQITPISWSDGSYIQITFTASTTTPGLNPFITFENPNGTTAYTSPFLTNTMTTYTATIKMNTTFLVLHIWGGATTTFVWNAFSIQRMDAIPPSLGYGAMTFATQDTGVTAANLTVVYPPASITASGSGPYTYTLAAGYTTYTNPGGINYTSMTLPAGTQVTVTVVASTSSAPTYWGIGTSGVYFNNLFGTLTGTPTTYTTTFTVPSNSVNISISMAGPTNCNVIVSSFNVKYTLGGNTIMNGNVGIGTTTPYTANFQLAQGLTADLGGALKTQFTDTGLTAANVVVDAGGGAITGSGPYTFTTNTTNGTLRITVPSSTSVLCRITITCNITSGTGSLYSTNGVIGLFTSPTLTSTYQTFSYTGLNSSGSFYFVILSASGTVFNYASVTIHRIDTISTGNVGIGTAGPTALLHVQGVNSGATQPLMFLKNSADATNTGASLRFGTFGSSSPSNPAAEINAICTNGSFGITDLAFSTYNYSGGALYGERMRITAAGNVGIGTATPTYKQEIWSSTGQIFYGYAGASNTFAIYAPASSSAGWGSSSSVVFIAKDTVTNRSLNSAGTLNASGTDYAEYMTKEGDFVAQKGDIIGITAARKLTNQFDQSVMFLIKSTNPCMVGGDVWGTDEAVGMKRPEPLKEDATEEEKAAYDTVFAEWTAAMESARQKVDRMAFAGQVPVNVMGAQPGDYIVPVRRDDGTIGGQAVSSSTATFDQYRQAVGRVMGVLEDGRAHVIVKTV